MKESIEVGDYFLRLSSRYSNKIIYIGKVIEIRYQTSPTAQRLLVEVVGTINNIYKVGAQYDIKDSEYRKKISKEEIGWYILKLSV